MVENLKFYQNSHSKSQIKRDFMHERMFEIDQYKKETVPGKRRSY